MCGSLSGSRHHAAAFVTGVVGSVVLFSGLGWWLATRGNLFGGAPWGVLVLGAASLPTLISAAHRTGHEGRLRIDILSPCIAFSLMYGSMYGTGFWRGSMRDSAIVLDVAQYVLEGLVFFWGGALVTKIVFSAWMSREEECSRTCWTTSRLHKAIWALFALSIVVYAVSLRRTGMVFLGPGFESARTETINQIGGYAFYVVRSVVIAILLGVVCLVSHRPGRWGQAALWVMIGCAGFTLLSTGYRNGVGVAVVGTVIFFHYGRRPLRTPELATMAGLLLLSLATYGVWRSGSADMVSAEILEMAWHELSLPLYTLSLTVDRIPENLPFMQGRAVLMTFSVLLPGKQPTLGLWLKEQFGLHFAGGGFGPSMLGGFYVEFGEAGVCVGMFLIGAILQACYVVMRREPSDYSILFYAFVLTYSIEAIRDGFLVDVFPVWFLLVITVSHLVMTRLPRIWVLRRNGRGGSGRLVGPPGSDAIRDPLGL